MVLIIVWCIVRYRNLKYTFIYVQSGSSLENSFRSFLTKLETLFYIDPENVKAIARFEQSESADIENDISKRKSISRVSTIDQQKDINELVK